MNHYYISQLHKNSKSKIFVIELMEIKTLSHYWLIHDLGLNELSISKECFKNGNNDDWQITFVPAFVHFYEAI